MINDRLNMSKIDVWKTESKFPAEKWENANTTIKFLSVNWDAKYEHVVDWASDESRDEWFRNHDGWDYDMETAWNFKSLEVFKPGLGRHVGTIKVAVPYESIINFNYIAVEMSTQPVPGMEESRREVFYYFLTSLNKTAPNTTELFLELDTWTTYKNSINISGVKLTRGHYAHALTSADKYLSNPLENQLGLTEPEPDFPDVKPLISSENFISFQKSSPRVCIATTADLTDLDRMWLNVKEIYRIHQEKGKPLPDDYWWDSGIWTADTQFLGSNGNAPVPPVGAPSVNGNTPGVRVYSISPTDYPNFISLLRKKLPQMLKTIQGIFLLDSDLIDEGPAITAFGFSFKPVVQQSSYKMLEEIGLSKELFEYSPEYEDFAKLYTSQFAVIEVSNMQGKTAEISIEDIAGSLQVYGRSSSAFPFLKLEAFINGVGGSEKKSYAVKPWNNTNAELFKSQWEDFNFELNIPVHGVFVESHEVNGPKAQGRIVEESQLAWFENSINTNNANTEIAIGSNTINKTLLNARDSINKEYDNSITSIGRNYSNSTDSIGLRFNNETDEIGKDYTNANKLNVTDKDINDASIYRFNENAVNSINTEYSNSVSLMETEKANETLSANVDKEVAIATGDNEYNITYFNLRAEQDLYDVNQRITSTSAKLNIWQIAEAAKVNVAAGALNTIGSALTSMSPISAVGSSISAAVDVGVTERLTEINTQMLAWQTNLSNSKDPVSITQDIGGLTVAYNGDSFNKARLDYSQDTTHNEAASRQALVWSNAGKINDTAISNINDSTTAAGDAYLASKDVNLGIAEQNKSTDTNNNYIRYVAKDEVIARHKNVRSGITNRSKTVDSTISVRDKNTDINLADRTKTIDDAIAERERTTDSENIQRKFDSDIRNVSSRSQSQEYSRSTGYYSELLEAPTMYGESTGNAWVDNWGQRGLDIRVRRCAKAIEEIAGNTFYRYGYRAPGIWIDKPVLSLMDHFTYWEAEEAWVFGNLINETNKELIRSTLKNGVTVWNNPDEVCSIDITINKPRSN